MGSCSSQTILPPITHDKIYATVWKTELLHTRDVRFTLKHIRSHDDVQYKFLKLLSILKSMGYHLERRKDTLCCTMIVKDIARLKMRLHDLPMMACHWSDFSNIQ